MSEFRSTTYYSYIRTESEQEWRMIANHIPDYARAIFDRDPEVMRITVEYAYGGKTQYEWDN